MATQQKRDTNQDKGAERKRLTAQPQGQELDALTGVSDFAVLQRAVADPAAASPADILALQRGYGNRAVSGLVQTKLTVGAAGDQYEQEADRVAEQVMTMPAPGVSQQPAALRQPGVQRQEMEEEEELQMKPAAEQQAVQRQEEEEEVQMKPLAASVTPLIQRQDMEDEEELQMKPVDGQPLVQRQEMDEEEELQMKPDTGQQTVQRQEMEEEEELQMKPSGQVRADGSFEASSGLEGSLSDQKGRGSPLPSEVRAFMEPRFGADFSGVRVHTGDTATQLNRSLSSRAFTHGQDIYVRDGDYSPGTASGQELLAHELTHTLQQGAAHRIQGWWPRGHKLVTEVALEQGNLEQIYGEDARKYLIDRSPDVDFIQDQIVTMDQGIQLGKSAINMYENLIASGQDKRAEQMWKDNELHYRKPAYMMSHGEGGRYKEADPAAINEAMTKEMVNVAAQRWSWEPEANNTEALSRLSDALHQAEDRGSHGEGREFTGHDSRLNVLKWTEESGRDAMPWEEWKGAPAQIRALAAAGKWAPDNFSVNKGGGVLAIGFAQGALNLFANLIGQPAKGEPIALNPGVEAKKRSAQAAKFLPFMKSSNLLVGIIGKSGKGWRKGKKKKTLEKLLEHRQKLIVSGELKAGDYEKSMQTPEVKEAVMEDESAKQMVEEGVTFYETGAGFDQVFQDAEAQFREWGQKRKWWPGSWGKGKGKGKKKSERIKLAKKYFVDKLEKVKDKPQVLVESAAMILKAYEQVFGGRLYATGRTPYELVNKTQKR